MADGSHTPAQPLRLTSPHDDLAAKFASIDAAFDSVMPKRPDRWLTGVTAFAGVSDSVAMANDARLTAETANNKERG